MTAIESSPALTDAFARLAADDPEMTPEEMSDKLYGAYLRVKRLLEILPRGVRTKSTAMISDCDLTEPASIALALVFSTDFLKEETDENDNDDKEEEPIVVVKGSIIKAQPDRRVPIAPPPPPAQAAPARVLGVKESLLADKRVTHTARAVNAESAGTLLSAKARVLALARKVIDEAGAIAAFTPGFASGRHWAPIGGQPTTGSAAYSRWNKKYRGLGYCTMVPVYIDERPVTSAEIWRQRKDNALEIEKHLHRSLGDLPLYSAREGGSEPGFSKSTKFYVYVAIK